MVKVINQPHDLGAENADFQFCCTFGIHAPGKERRSQQRKPADKACGEGAYGQHKLQQNKENLQKCGIPEFYENQIPENGDDITDKTADTTQNQISGTHEQALNALGNENGILSFQKADQHHDQTAHHGNGVADKKQIHNSTSMDRF